MPLPRFGHDLVARRWCAAAPNEDQVKLFLFAGDGTALLMLHFTDLGIEVENEPDVYAVWAPPLDHWR